MRRSRFPRPSIKRTAPNACWTCFRSWACHGVNTPRCILITSWQACYLITLEARPVGSLPHLLMAGTLLHHLMAGSFPHHLTAGPSPHHITAGSLAFDLMAGKEAHVAWIVHMWPVDTLLKGLIREPGGCPLLGSHESHSFFFTPPCFPRQDLRSLSYPPLSPSLLFSLSLVRVQLLVGWGGCGRAISRADGSWTEALKWLANQGMDSTSMPCGIRSARAQQ